MIASQEYAPWSASLVTIMMLAMLVSSIMMAMIGLHASGYLAMGQVSSPKALFSSISVLVIEHFSGTWPQLSLQTTSRHHYL